MKKLHYSSNNQIFRKLSSILSTILKLMESSVAIPTAVANVWLQCCFLWLNPLTPLGFVAFVILTKDFIFNDSLHEGIILIFSPKYGITISSLTKLTKTPVTYPNSIELMLGRVEAISVFTNLFLQKKDIVKGLSYLFTLCKSNQTLPKSNHIWTRCSLQNFFSLLTTG